MELNLAGSRTTDMQIDFVESKKVMITFNVTSGPPTYVSCVGPEDFRVNETSDEVNRVMIDENTTGISVILKERYEGLIQCNVSNKRVQQGTINDVVATVATTSLVITTEGITIIINNICIVVGMLFTAMHYLTDQ